VTQEKQLALPEVRKAMYDRLKRYSLTDEMLADKSLFQLVTLAFLLVGQYNYIGTYTCTCRTLEEIFGEQALYYRIEKPENIVSEANEPKPVIN
jgi:hypothetical protein